VGLEQAGQLVLVIGVGKEIFHRLEAGRLGGSEALQEGHLVEQHGQVGCKFGHVF
jgi:hypothetical protein